MKKKKDLYRKARNWKAGYSMESDPFRNFPAIYFIRKEINNPSKPINITRGSFVSMLGEYVSNTDLQKWISRS